MSSYYSFRLLLYIFLISTVSCSNTTELILETAYTKSYKIEGHVFEEGSEKIIPNAEVWVSKSTTNDVVNSDGKYSIELPNGYYELVVRAKGYYSTFRRIDVESSTIHDFNLIPKQARKKRDNQKEELTNKSRQLDLTSSSSSKYDQIQNFIDYYINDELNCELLNPEDIHFEDTNDKMLRVKDEVELWIMNHELGYKVTVILNEFIAKQYSGIVGINSDAQLLFKELTPQTEVQKVEWEKKRLQQFNGSFRHFLISMASEKSPLYFGYRIYSGQFVSRTSAMAYSSSSVSDIEVRKYDFFFPQLNGNTVLQLDGELRVEYVAKGIKDPNGIMGLDQYRYQTSWLSLKSPSIKFSNNGTVQNPENVEKKGVWRYTPICKMLPVDYLPKVDN